MKREDMVVFQVGPDVGLAPYTPGNLSQQCRLTGVRGPHYLNSNCNWGITGRSGPVAFPDVTKATSVFRIILSSPEFRLWDLFERNFEINVVWWHFFSLLGECVDLSDTSNDNCKRLHSIKFRA